MYFRDFNSLVLSQAWRRGGGEQIREPCPVRAQSAGGNASGKPPYPCSDLEDALTAARSRHSGQRSCAEYQPAAHFSGSYTQQQRKTILDWTVNAGFWALSKKVRVRWFLMQETHWRSCSTSSTGDKRIPSDDLKGGLWQFLHSARGVNDSVQAVSLYQHVEQLLITWHVSHSDWGRGSVGDSPVPRCLSLTGPIIAG